jgi:hypothetical protein
VCVRVCVYYERERERHSNSDCADVGRGLPFALWQGVVCEDGPLFSCVNTGQG